ncbi:helix-turn-helix domain-containing protein [Thiomicrolovo sp. ZZH C-3]
MHARFGQNRVMEKIVHRAYKYRLSPSAEQAAVLMGWADAKRFVWNKALALCETRLSNGHLEA